MTELVPLLFVALAFGSVAALVFALGQHYAVRARMERRLPAMPEHQGEMAARPLRTLNALAARIYPQNRLRAFREKARRELLRAGFFGVDAVETYLFARLVSMLALPTIALLLTSLFPVGTPALLSVILVLVATFVAIAGPDAFLARRHRLLVRQFPPGIPGFP